MKELIITYFCYVMVLICLIRFITADAWLSIYVCRYNIHVISNSNIVHGLMVVKFCKGGESLGQPTTRWTVDLKKMYSSYECDLPKSGIVGAS